MRQSISRTPTPDFSLSQYIDACPSPAHALKQSIAYLEAAGAIAMQPGVNWQLAPGKLYFCNFSGRSLFAWRMPQHEFSSFRTVAAHLDSPCFRIRERSVQWEDGFLLAGTEPYGGVVQVSWLDRPLRIAGQAVVRDSEFGSRLVTLELEGLMALIPNLAIHLNRDINKSVELNAQTQLRALVALELPEPKPQRPWEWLVARQLSRVENRMLGDTDILALDLFLSDAQSAQTLGDPMTVINAPRLDNLAGCQAALQALLTAQVASDVIQLVCLFDHEEIGSRSAAGADSTVFMRLLRRIALASSCRDELALLMAVESSLLLSVDAAHARHPNFPDKHDSAYAPRLNAGIVMKANVNQRYATTPGGAARLRMLCENRGIPLQYFTNRADQACGSTIGPALAAASGMATIDLGIPMLAMHSCRETAGLQDQKWMIAALAGFLEET